MKPGKLRSVTAPLTPGERLKGRKIYSFFAFFNALSFFLLSGNIITLYALRLGASSWFIGLISSFPYVSYFFIFAGKQLVPLIGTVRLFGISWFVRYIMIIPIAFSPLMVSRGNMVGAFALMVIGLLGFQAARGVGIVGNNPILGEVSSGKDRGSYIARTHIITHIVSILTGICIILFLGSDAPLSRYLYFILAGIVIGFMASGILFRLPEPPSSKEDSSKGLIKSFVVACRRRPFRVYIAVTAALFFLTGMARPFIIVFAKQVFLQPDRVVVFFTVVGSFGAVSMGLLSRFLIDRLGPKPMYILFAGFFAVSLVVAFAMPKAGPVGTLIYLSLLFYLLTLGANGVENTAQTYFFNIIEAGESVNLGIVYSLALGVMGTLGSVFGGFFIDWLSLFSNNISLVFRIFFAVLVAGTIPVLISMSRLKTFGSYSIKDALEILFSPKDLRAIMLMNKLERVKDEEEEQEVIKALGDSQSELPIDVLLQKMKSPRYSIRAEALHALRNLPLGDDEDAVNALIEEVRQHPFTTAYIAAEMIGEKRLERGREVLLKSLSSEDYLLRSEAMLALGRLGEKQIIPEIEKVLKESDNPHTLIHGAAALHALASVSSIPVLLEVLRKENPPPFLRDEIILSISGILGMDAWFYPFYTSFLENFEDGIDRLKDTVKETVKEGFDAKHALFMDSFSRLKDDKEGFGLLITNYCRTAFPSEFGSFPYSILCSAATDPQLNQFIRLRFFLAALAVWLTIKGK